MIRRTVWLARVSDALRHNPVVALTGPRQCGKTTLARAYAAGKSVTYFDMERAQDYERLSRPMLALEDVRGLVIIDEVQRRPEIFETLRVLADRRPIRARFLILGSAAPDLIRGVSESLAGRIATLRMDGFTLAELRAADFKKLWARGGFPRSYLAVSDRVSFRWREDFIQTFLERDIPQLGISIPSAALRRFWTMLAHYHGQIWKSSELARSMGVSEPTSRKYLDLLTDSFVVRQIQPYHSNIAKRQVKAPKVYIRDTGILHALLGLTTMRDVLNHPKCGLSWESFAIEQLMRLGVSPDAYFWATHAGAELDLMIRRKGRWVGFECKFTDSPSVTRSMRIALSDLKLECLYILYPGKKSYRLDKRVDVLSIDDIQDAFK